MKFRHCACLLGLALLAVGCGGSNDGTTKPNSPPPPDKPQSGEKPGTNPSDAVAALKKMGAHVSVYKDKPDSVILAGKNANSTSLALLGQMPTLSSVSFLNAQAKPADYEVLTKLERLSSLSFDRTELAPETLKTIEKLTGLSTLLVEKANLTAKDLSHFAPHEHLSVFGLEGNDLSGSKMEILANKSKLLTLSLNNTNLDNAALPAISKLPKLQALHLEGCKGITDMGIAKLHGVKTLRRVVLTGTSVTDKGVEALKGAIPGVTVTK